MVELLMDLGTVLDQAAPARHVHSGICVQTVQVWAAPDASGREVASVPAGPCSDGVIPSQPHPPPRAAPPHEAPDRQSGMYRVNPRPLLHRCRHPAGSRGLTTIKDPVPEV